MRVTRENTSAVMRIRRFSELLSNFRGRVKEIQVESRYVETPKNKCWLEKPGFGQPNWLKKSITEETENGRNKVTPEKKLHPPSHYANVYIAAYLRFFHIRHDHQPSRIQSDHDERDGKIHDIRQ